MRLLFLVLLSIFCIFTNTTIAQKSVKKDSLENVLQTQTLSDTMTIKMRLWLGHYYLGNNTIKSMENANKVLVITQNKERHKDMAEAYRILTANYAQKNENMDTILFYNQKGIFHAEQANDLMKKAYMLNSLGITYRKKGDYKKAISTSLTALNLGREIKDTNIIVNTLNSIAVVFYYQKDFKKARKYFQESKTYAEAMNFTLMIASTTMNLGNVYKQEEKIDTALIYYQEALVIKRHLGNRYSLIKNLQNIGSIYLKQEQYKLAIESFEESLAISKEMKSISGQSAALEGLGWAALEQKKHNQAVKYGEQGLALLSDKTPILTQKNLHEFLHLAYEQRKKYALAYKHLKQYQLLQDSLHNQNQTELIHELETQYQVEQKETENQLLKAEHKSDQKNIQYRNILIIAILLGFLLISSWSFVLYRSKQQTNQYNQLLEKTVTERTADLKQANYELRTFNYIASHDIKEPIRNIGSYVGLIRRKLPQDLKQDLGHYFMTIKQSTTQLYTLIEDFAKYTTLSKDEKIDLEQVNLDLLTNNITQTLEPTIKRYKGQVTYSNLPNIEASNSLLFTLLKNLIENGLKYNQSEQPTVNVSYETIENGHKIIVTDNGIGIESQYHSRIFEMFKRLHNRSEYEGSGIGLAIVKLAVDKLNGTISLNSALNKGSTFTITLPS